MNVLITGANGFLGKSLAESESMRKHTVFKIQSDRSTNDNSQTLSVDLSSLDAPEKILNWLKGKKIDVCFHFAGVTPFHGKDIDFRKDLEMAKTITEICKNLDISTLVYSSGWVVYTNPINEYGQSKLNVENYFKNSLGKTTCVNLRLASIYGPGQISQGLIPNLVRSAINSGQMAIRSLKTKRDYVYIDDFVSLCLDIMKYKGESVSLDIGSGESYSVKAVSQTIQDIFQSEYGMNLPITIEEKIVEADTLDNKIDNSNVEKILGFRPTTSFRKGLLCYIQWMKKNQ